MYLWLANGVAVMHGAIVATVALGALAAMLGMLRRRPRWERAYYALLVVANVLWGECPLTRWEQGLRNWNAPGSAYCSSFIGHYLPLLPPRTLAWLGPALMAGAFLAAPLWRQVDRRRRPA
jgi:hypothetical protein